MLSSSYKNDGEPLGSLKLSKTQVAARDAIVQKIESGTYILETKPCLICDSSNFLVLSQKERYGIHFPIGICRRCGLVQTRPRMTKHSCNAFYQNEYRRLYKREDAPLERRYTMQRGRGKRLLAFLTERNAVKESAFIFEMGCGGGGILKVFQENGFQVQGIDIDAQYVDRGRRELGLNLSTESIENVVWEKTPDIVILSHVLEHLPDPEAELRKLSKRIDDKTLLYVAAPGTKNFFVASKHIRLMHHFEFAHLYYTISL